MITLHGWLSRLDTVKKAFSILRTASKREVEEGEREGGVGREEGRRERGERDLSS